MKTTLHLIIRSLRSFGLGHYALFLAAVLTCGCATYRTIPLEKTDYLKRAKSQSDGGAEITASVLSDKEGQNVLGVPIAKNGIQIVWLKIENKDKIPYLFSLRGVDPLYFSAGEAAYVSRYKLIEKDRIIPLNSLIFFPVNIFRYPYLNEKIRERFRVYDLRNTIINPGETISGFVYTPLDKGTKQIPVSLMGPHQDRYVTFAIDIQGISQDYKRSNFAERYQPSDFKNYSGPDLEKVVEAMPCCTTNKKGTKNGDPLNLLIVGDLDDILIAFKIAGWDETEILNFSTAMKMAKAFLNGSDYRYAPVSNLYFEGRRHDIALQKTRSNIDERLHLRLWYTPMQFEKKPVWIGQVSRDIGVRLTKRAWNLMTHQIDPDIDESREYVAADLSLAERVKYFGYIKGVGEITPKAPSHNLTGDPYYTDGMRLAVVISDLDVKPIFTDWDLILEQTKNGKNKS